ncbi:uncharacterized protein AC631_04028 [Debaryomyces fabryi]|uniref:Uncharacterized protein n=1 Tax=Debaryomyces fabryi TaxID=58627 RepID=A0A0V1PW10_9ASCO|nr:uncharacterized protein AC631_04028 [Debaryomyces fabryi]KSA00236.1 hypothetical protein AC631_04028 [Debaryomyces fabryi]CUM54646.1 unnamed protein product [Debaryomyces fabryi]
MIGPSIPKDILEKRRKQSDKKNTENDSSDESDDEIVGPLLPETIYNKSINLEQIADKKEEKKAQHDDSKTVEAQTLHMEQNNLSQYPIRERQTLLSKHRAKNTGKNKVTKFDSKENLNSEIRKEILRKLDQNGGLEGKFTRGS